MRAVYRRGLAMGDPDCGYPQPFLPALINTKPNTLPYFHTDTSDFALAYIPINKANQPKKTYFLPIFG